MGKRKQKAENDDVTAREVYIKLYNSELHGTEAYVTARESGYILECLDCLLAYRMEAHMEAADRQRRSEQDV